MTATPAPLTSAQLAHARHELRTPVNAIIGYSEMLLEDLEVGAEAGVSLQRIQQLGKMLQTIIGEQLDGARLERVGSEDSAHPTGPLDISHVEAQPTLNADVLGADVRRALLPPTQQVLVLCQALSQQTNDPAVAPLLPDVDKIATATGRLLAMLDDPLQLTGTVEKSADHSPLTTHHSPLTTHHSPLTTRHSPPGPPPSNQSDEDLPTSEEEFRQGRTGRVLVVDDNLFNREMLARGLHRQMHYFALAANGKQALELLETGTFDLVLLDILMPEMDGFEVLRRIKADSRISHMPVIMISALDQIDSVVRCIEMGAEDYLPKPFNPVLLKARVGACLEKKRLRDQELEYLRNVAKVTAVASEVEAGTFRPEALDGVSQRPDSLGQLARVFQSMVREIKAREERLKQEVHQLRVEIDEGRKARQVAEITETDYFQELQKRAQALKGRKRPT